MRKDFYRHRPRRAGLFSRVSAAAAILVLVLVLVEYLAPGALSGAARRAAHPLWAGGNVVREGARVFLASLGTRGNLVRENQELLEQLQRVETAELRNRVLTEENISLKELLGRRRFEELVLAPVLRRPSQTPYDTLIVDVEGVPEVRLGNRAVVDGGIVIGLISRIDGGTATVTLFSTLGLETEVFVGTSTASITARGLGGGNFVARVPRGLSIGEGDSVVFPHVFPLLFATVALVESEPADPFETIRFRNPVNVNALRWVEIIINDSEEPRQELPTTEEEKHTEASEEQILSP